MSLSQAQIDQYNLDTNVTVDAAGDGYQPYEECAIVGLWKPDDDTPDDDPACHKIGIPHPVGTQVYTKTVPYNTGGSGVLIDFPSLSEVITAGVAVARPVTGFGRFYSPRSTNSIILQRSITYYIPNSPSIPVVTKTYLPLEYYGHSIRIDNYSSLIADPAWPTVFYAIVKPWDGVIKQNFIMGEDEATFTITPRVCAKLTSISAILGRHEGSDLEINVTAPEGIGLLGASEGDGFCMMMENEEYDFDVEDKFTFECSTATDQFDLVLKFE